MKKGTVIISQAQRQSNLLNKLVNDTCDRLPENERGINKVSIESLIWNLFKGDYLFNAGDIKFIINEKLKADALIKY